MEKLSRYREPAAAVAIGALALNILVGLVGAFFSPVSLADMAVATAYRVGDPVFVAAVAGLVALCVRRDTTRHARTLTVLGLGLAALGLVVGIVLAAVGVAWRPPGETLDVLNVFPLLVLSAVGVATLLLLLRAQPVGTARPQPALDAPRTTEAAVPEVPRTPAPDPALQPTWTSDTAAGAAWHRAGDAASGAPASGWGAAGSDAGWQPVPAAPPALGPGSAAPSKGWSGSWEDPVDPSTTDDDPAAGPRAPRR